ncbi:MAG: IS1380 family transposase, partial [Phycisphaerales bacterium]|nr:IS1380 family transposase [Phycisphaerales bacterium]
RLGLKNTSMARARCDTIRLKLLKIGAQVRVTFRKVWVSLAESCPYRRIFQQVHDHLVGIRPIQLRC